MELHLHSRKLAENMPDWAAAAISGFVAGALLMVIEMLWATDVTDATPWTMSHMIAAVITGPDTAQGHHFDVGVVAIALATHYILGMVYGTVLAIVLAGLRIDAGIGRSLAVGALFGMLLYLVNFYGMTVFFPWFTEARGLPTFMAHVLFGMASAFFYCKLERHKLPV